MQHLDTIQTEEFIVKTFNVSKRHNVSISITDDKVVFLSINCGQETQVNVDLDMFYTDRMDTVETVADALEITGTDVFQMLISVSI